MFSYIMLGTNDLPRAIKFYDPLMALLGHVKAGRNEQGRPRAPSTAITPAGCAWAFLLTNSLPGWVMERWWRLTPAPSHILRNCMPSPCNSADVTKAVPVTGRSMATVFTAPTSAIPTAISWRLFTMRLQIEWLQRRWLLQAEIRESGRPTRRPYSPRKKPAAQALRLIFPASYLPQSDNVIRRRAYSVSAAS